MRSSLLVECPLSFVSDNSTTKQYNYQNATALIVTFTVNNHIKEEDNAMAEAWEKAFLDYVKNYNGTHVNISYLAEVRCCVV